MKIIYVNILKIISKARAPVVLVLCVFLFIFTLYYYSDIYLFVAHSSYNLFSFPSFIFYNIVARNSSKLPDERRFFIPIH